MVGHPRSGTTLLRLILDSHPRIVIPPEGHLVSLLRRAERKFGDLRDDANFERLLERLLNKARMVEWGLDPADARRRCLAGERTPGGVFAAIMSIWLERTGKPRWGEKTPGTYRFVPDVDRWFPDCQVVHIVRDGRDVAVSCLTPPFADMYDKGDVYEVAARWKDAVRRGNAAARRLGPSRYHELRYEDLTADPEGKVRELCAFLREDFDPAMLEYHRKSPGKVPRGERSYHQRTHGQVDTQRVERWRRDASEEFVLGFEGLAGAELEQKGYTPSGYSAPPALAGRILLERLRPRRPVKHYRGEKRSGGSEDAAPGTGGGSAPSKA